MELVATHFLPWKSEGETTHSIRFCSALSWLRRFLYTVSASVESSTSKGILKGEQIILVWMKLLKTVRTIYYDVNDQNFVDDWSPVFRGVTIKEIGLHPSGVLRVLNKPAQSPSLASRHQHQIEWIKASPFLFQVINRMMAYHRSKSWCSLILCWTRSQSLQEWKHWNSNFFICIFVSSVFHPPPGTILDQYLYQRWLFCLSRFCMVSRGDKCISYMQVRK